MPPNLIKGRLAGWKVLVVDDEPDSLEVAQRWLRIAGATIFVAHHGKEALEIVRKESLDFVITDLTMPVMDGWELFYEIRQNTATQTLPAICLTAHAMESTRVRALQAGFLDHIPKPLSPTKFVENVVEILNTLPSFADRLSRTTAL